MNLVSTLTNGLFHFLSVQGCGRQFRGIFFRQNHWMGLDCHPPGN